MRLVKEPVELSLLHRRQSPLGQRLPPLLSFSQEPFMPLGGTKEDENPGFVSLTRLDKGDAAPFAAEVRSSPATWGSHPLPGGIFTGGK